MFITLAKELQNVENWIENPDTTVSSLMGALLPDIRRTINILQKPIMDMEAEYSANVEEGPNSNVLNRIISHFADIGMQTLERMMLTGGDRLAHSYYAAAMQLSSPAVTAADLLNPIKLPLHTIETSFKSLCNELLDAIQIVMTGTLRNMKRTENAYDDDSFDMKNVPSDFVPVVFPYMTLVLANDYTDMKANMEDSEYPQHIETTIYNLLSMMESEVNRQVKAAYAALVVAINTSDKLTEENKKGLILMVDRDIGKAERRLDNAKENAADNLKKELPDSFDDPSISFWSLLVTAQNNGNECAKDFNYHGQKIMGDLINWYEYITVLKK